MQNREGTRYSSLQRERTFQAFKRGLLPLRMLESEYAGVPLRNGKSQKLSMAPCVLPQWPHGAPNNRIQRKCLRGRFCPHIHEVAECGLVWEIELWMVESTSYSLPVQLGVLCNHNCNEHVRVPGAQLRPVNSYVQRVQYLGLLFTHNSHTLVLGGKPTLVMVTMHSPDIVGSLISWAALGRSPQKGTGNEPHFTLTPHEHSIPPIPNNSSMRCITPCHRYS